MPDVTESENLLNALLDGQLDAEQAALATARIAADPHLSAMLNAFKRQRDEIGQLPAYRLNKRFTDRVLELAALNDSQPSSVQHSKAASIDWKKYAMSLAAIAALLMAMLVYQWTPGSSETAMVAQQELDAGGKANLNAPFAVENEKLAGRDLIVNPTAKALASGDVVQTNGQSDFAFTAETDAEESAGLTATPPTQMISKREGHAQSQGNQEIARKTTAPLKAQPGDGWSGSNASGSAVGTASLAEVAPGGNSTSAGQSLARATVSPPSNPPAIDQVWVLDVDQKFTQQQLLQSLAANSIATPSESKRSPVLLPPEATGTQSDAASVDGIYVVAKPSQMRQALNQLSQSGDVVISAFQLPGSPVDSNPPSGVDVTESKVSSSAPLTITAPQQAMAQRLRGRRFEFTQGPPSSKIPESFDKLEAMMGVPYQDGSVITGDNKSAEPKSIASRSIAAIKGVKKSANPSALFLSQETEPETMNNFLILIRQNTKAPK